ncbi:MAG TPA: hypothetical protein VME63_16350 [Dyella sp.]|uniref:hypothetical protein n=1 Tax=Dyella sp. TaxID=1869338 RepID=UPI002CA0062F|nr:hypothetical protein [Dyella sp.]HTV86972.1 hypothetical protein [Dyella sp.]
MNVTATYPAPGQAQDSASHYQVEEQSDGQLCFQTYPATKPIFTFDATLIIVGFAFPILLLDYVLLTLGNYAPALVTTLMAAGVAWLCLRILHRERRDGVRPCRFYVSDTTLNIPPAPNTHGSMTMLQASNIDRLVIRQTLAHTSSLAYGFGTVGAKGAEARDRRNGWFADRSFILEAQSAGRGYMLASGLDETTVHGLMKAVSRKLGF